MRGTLFGTRYHPAFPACCHSGLIDRLSSAVRITVPAVRSLRRFKPLTPNAREPCSRGASPPAFTDPARLWASQSRYSFPHRISMYFHADTIIICPGKDVKMHLFAGQYNAVYRILFRNCSLNSRISIVFPVSLASSAAKAIR